MLRSEIHLGAATAQSQAGSGSCDSSGTDSESTWQDLRWACRGLVCVLHFRMFLSIAGITANRSGSGDSELLRALRSGCNERFQQLCPNLGAQERDNQDWPGKNALRQSQRAFFFSYHAGRLLSWLLRSPCNRTSIVKSSGKNSSDARQCPAIEVAAQRRFQLGFLACGRHMEGLKYLTHLIRPLREEIQDLRPPLRSSTPPLVV